MQVNLIGIRYEEFKAGTYAGVEVSEPGPGLSFKEPRVFFTGSPVRDFEAAMAAYEGQRFMFMSSFDHFMSDDPEAAAGLERYR